MLFEWSIDAILPLIDTQHLQRGAKCLLKGVSAPSLKGLIGTRLKVLTLIDILSLILRLHYDSNQRVPSLHINHFEDRAVQRQKFTFPNGFVFKISSVSSRRPSPQKVKKSRKTHFLLHSICVVLHLHGALHGSQTSGSRLKGKPQKMDLSDQGKTKTL